MFNLDFKLQVFRFLPTELKKTAKAETQHWNWISVLVEGIVSIGFSVFRKNVNEELRWGRSKIQVEAFLRERFNEQNIFLVTEIVSNFEFLVFPASYDSRTPLILNEGGNYIVRSSGELQALEQSQLTVLVPSYLQSQEDQLRVYLRKYLHTSFIYQIQYT